MATHKELITSGKFDEKFKRALLDYYNYGFKNLGSLKLRNVRLCQRIGCALIEYYQIIWNGLRIVIQ